MTGIFHLSYTEDGCIQYIFLEGRGPVLIVVVILVVSFNKGWTIVQELALQTKIMWCVKWHYLIQNTGGLSLKCNSLKAIFAKHVLSLIKISRKQCGELNAVRKHNFKVRCQAYCCTQMRRVVFFLPTLR